MRHILPGEPGMFPGPFGIWYGKLLERLRRRNGPGAETSEPPLRPDDEPGPEPAKEAP